MRLTTVWLCLLFLQGMISAQVDDDTYFIQVDPDHTFGEVLAALAQDYGFEIGYNPILAGRTVARAGSLEGSIQDLLDITFGEEIEILRPRTDQLLIRQKDPRTTESNHPKTLLIYDSENQIPVSDVLIYTDAYDWESISDQDGYVEVDYTGTRSDLLIVNRLGYNDARYPLAQVKSGDTLVLRGTPLYMPEILVRPELLEASLSFETDFRSRQLGSGRTLHPAGPLVSNDFLRSLQRVAGLAHDDGNARPAIRGSNWDETLIILDGIPIYRSDHFFGIFGSINGQHVETFDLYRNNFPIEYAGKTAGLLRLEGPREMVKTQGILDVGRLTTSAHIEVPLHQKFALSVSGRTSYRNVAQSDLLDISTGVNENREPILRTFPEFNFNDINVKAVAPLSEHHQLEASYYRSADQLENRYSLSYPTRFQDRFVTLEEALLNTEDWNSEGAAINYHLDISPSLHIDFSGHVSTYRSNGLIEANVFERNQGQITAQNAYTNSQENTLRTGEGKVVIKKSWDTHHIKLGSSFTQFENLTKVREDDILILGTKILSYNLGSFASYSYTHAKFQITAAMRADYYAATGEWLTSPRLRFYHTLTNDLSWKGAVGYNFQFVRALSYENRLGQSIDLLVLNDADNYPFTRSINSMLGLKLEKRSWLLDLEFYQKNIDGVAEYSLLFPGFSPNGNPSTTRNFNLFIGTGTIVGMDLSFLYENQIVSTGLTYTLSKNENAFPAIQQGRKFLARNDRRHQFKFTNQLNIGALALTADFYFSSGRRYLDLAQVATGTDRSALIPNSTLRHYHRLDVGISYIVPIQSKELKFYASVFNAYDRDNVKYLQYVFGINTSPNGNQGFRTLVGAETNLLPRTLNLGAEFKF